MVWDQILNVAHPKLHKLPDEAASKFHTSSHGFPLSCSVLTVSPSHRQQIFGWRRLARLFRQTTESHEPLSSSLCVCWRLLWGRWCFQTEPLFAEWRSVHSPSATHRHVSFLKSLDVVEKWKLFDELTIYSEWNKAEESNVKNLNHMTLGTCSWATLVAQSRKPSSQTAMTDTVRKRRMGAG